MQGSSRPGLALLSSLKGGDGRSGTTNARVSVGAGTPGLTTGCRRRGSSVCGAAPVSSRPPAGTKGRGEEQGRTRGRFSSRSAGCWASSRGLRRFVPFLAASSLLPASPTASAGAGRRCRATRAMSVLPKSSLWKECWLGYRPLLLGWVPGSCVLVAPLMYLYKHSTALRLCKTRTPPLHAQPPHFALSFSSAAASAARLARLPRCFLFVRSRRSL